MVFEHQTFYRPKQQGNYAHGRKKYSERDVQILKIEDSPDELFRLEGSAEILDLDSNQSHRDTSGKFSHSSDSTFDPVKFNLEDYDEIQHRSVGIDNEGITFEQHRALPFSNFVEKHENKTKLKKSKMVQTEDSFLQRKMSKKVQTIHLDESDSDDDQELANQSLNQSMSSSLHGPTYDKSFQDPGFLNMAMRTLVVDQLKNVGRGKWNVHEAKQDTGEDNDLKSKKSFSRYTQNSDHDSLGARLSKKRGHIYGNGSRTPPTPNYTETKASILRRRTVNTQPQENSLFKNSSFLKSFHSSSMIDLSKRSNQRSEKQSKIHSSTPEGLERF